MGRFFSSSHRRAWGCGPYWFLPMAWHLVCCLLILVTLLGRCLLNSLFQRVWWVGQVGLVYILACYGEMAFEEGNQCVEWPVLQIYFWRYYDWGISCVLPVDILSKALAQGLLSNTLVFISLLEMVKILVKNVLTQKSIVSSKWKCSTAWAQGQQSSIGAPQRSCEDSVVASVTGGWRIRNLTFFIWKMGILTLLHFKKKIFARFCFHSRKKGNKHWKFAGCCEMELLSHHFFWLKYYSTI